MDAVLWLGNTLRNQMRASKLGRALTRIRPAPPLRSVCVVSATRLSEQDFWRQAALGRSLKPWLKHPMISASIRFTNSAGLPEVYNAHLKDADAADVLLFVHDDVWIEDTDWISKIKTGLARFDIVGVAGNTRILAAQSAWAFSGRNDAGDFVWDSGHLSGAVGHGQAAGGAVMTYGPAPASCELLDGVFLAVRSSLLRRSNVFFDERFRFDFYDMDFCRRARQLGLSLGTWPISLTHQSAGAFFGDRWEAARLSYLEKWIA